MYGRQVVVFFKVVIECRYFELYLVVWSTGGCYFKMVDVTGLW